MGFGSKKKGGFNKATKAFKADPSIANYVKIRRKKSTRADRGQRVWRNRPLFAMENELRQYQIDPNLVASIFDADEASISELSLLLWRGSSRLAS